jgi:hypothetical protein
MSIDHERFITIVQQGVSREAAERATEATPESAGLVGQLRSSVNLTKMMMYSVELY